MWEITDNNGTIHSGTKEEMYDAWTVMYFKDQNSIAKILSIKRKQAQELVEKYLCDWDGDLRLIQIHNVI